MVSDMDNRWAPQDMMRIALRVDLYLMTADLHMVKQHHAIFTE